MQLNQVGKIMKVVEEFCRGDKTTLDVAQALGENYESMGTLFTLTGVADIQGMVCPGVEPWRVLGTVTVLYLLRCNRALRGVVTEGGRRGLHKV